MKTASATPWSPLPRNAAGTWMTELSHSTFDALGRGGADFVIIDCQHSAIDETAVSAFLSRQRDDTNAFVRVSSLDAAAIGRVADAGAAGIIAPGIDTAADAEKLVRALRFAPRGARSYGPQHPRLGATPADVEGSVAAVALVESVTAIENVDAIAATDGIAALFVGPADLAITAGLPLSAAAAGDLDGYVRAARAACDLAGITLAVHAADVNAAQRWFGLGADAVAVGSARRLLEDAVRTLHADLAITESPATVRHVY